MRLTGVVGFRFGFDDASQEGFGFRVVEGGRNGSASDSGSGGAVCAWFKPLAPIVDCGTRQGNTALSRGWRGKAQHCESAYHEYPAS